MGVALAAEAAAQMGAHHLDGALDHGHDVAQHPADLKGGLGGGVHGQHPVLNASQGTFRLQATVLDPLQLVVAGHGHRRFASGRLHIAGLTAVLHEDGALGNAVLNGIDAVGGLPADLDRAGRRSGLLLALGHHQGQHVPQEVELPVTEHGLFPVKGAQPVLARHVFGGDDPQHAGHGLRLRQVQAGDCALGGGGPHKGAVGHVLAHHVAAVGQRAVGLGRAVQIPDGLAQHSVLLGLPLLLLPQGDGAVLQEPDLLLAGLLPPEPGRRQIDRLNDLYIAGTAAVVVFQRLDDLLLRGSGILVQQGLGCQDHPRRAEAALDGAHVQERLLDGMEAAVLPLQALNGEDLCPVHPGHLGNAGADGPPVHQHRAGAAVAGAAAVLGALQARCSPQIAEKGHVRITGTGDPVPVQHKLNRRFFHVNTPSIWELPPGPASAPSQI